MKSVAGDRIRKLDSRAKVDVQTVETFHVHIRKQVTVVVV